MKQIKGTKIFNRYELQEAADLLNNGKLIAFPTETVYGLGANALNETAVKSIFIAKGRPSDNPLIVHISEKKDINNLIADKLTEKAEILINKFWPGPLTIVLPKSKSVPDITTGGLNTIAIRIPNHPIALELLKKTKIPIAAPSANLSGSPSPTRLKHVIDDLAGKIDGIVDGGISKIGLESTVIDLCQDIPVILRPGDITYEQLTKLLGKIKINSNVQSKINDSSFINAISPGMKYKHYAPKAEVILVEGNTKSIKQKIQELINKENCKTGVMATAENCGYYKNTLVKNMGSKSNLFEIGSNIYKLLREFDDDKVNKIFIEGLPVKDLGLAIMNRLRKAADYKIIEI